jgi:hypothetical protein
VTAAGASVWDYLKKEGFAKSWKMWPGTTALYQGPEPHGAFLTTYVNDVALESINAKKGKFAGRCSGRLPEIIQRELLST